MVQLHRRCCELRQVVLTLKQHSSPERDSTTTMLDVLDVINGTVSTQRRCHTLLWIHQGNLQQELSAQGYFNRSLENRSTNLGSPGESAQTCQLAPSHQCQTLHVKMSSLTALHNSCALGGLTSALLASFPTQEQEIILPTGSDTLLPVGAFK